MVSISYTASANAAVRSLQAISKQMDISQTRIATGYKVNSAADNATAWNIAQAVRSDVGATENVLTGLSNAIGKVKVATGAIASVQSILGEIKTKLSEAYGATTAVKGTIQTQITSLQTQLKSVLAAASFDGSNLLRDGGSFTVAIGIGTGATGTDTTTLTSLSNAAGTAGTLGANSSTFSAGVTSGTSILGFTIASGSNAPDAEIAVLQSELNTAIDTVNTFASTLGATQKRLESHSAFIKKINEIKTTAVSSLIDADLDEESAKLSALQVKQQLATAALQIANQSQLNILRLFQ